MQPCTKEVTTLFFLYGMLIEWVCLLVICICINCNASIACNMLSIYNYSYTTIGMYMSVKKLESLLFLLSSDLKVIVRGASGGGRPVYCSGTYPTRSLTVKV